MTPLPRPLLADARRADARPIQDDPEAAQRPAGAWQAMTIREEVHRGQEEAEGLQAEAEEVAARGPVGGRPPKWVDPDATHPTVLTAREYAELLQLRNAAADRARKKQAEKRARFARRRALASHGARVLALAEEILRGLPVEPEAVIAARRSALTGEPEQVRSLAEVILAGLDPDPDAGRHRLALVGW